MLIRPQNFDIAKMKEALASMQPETDKTQAVFLELFPVIQESLNRGITKKALLEKLANLGLKLHPVKFATLYSKALSQQKLSAAPATRSTVGARK